MFGILSSFLFYFWFILVSLSFKNYKVSSEYLQEDDIDEDFQHIDDENRAVDKFEVSSFLYN